MPAVAATGGGRRAQELAAGHHDARSVNFRTYLPAAFWRVFFWRRGSLDLFFFANWGILGFGGVFFFSTGAATGGSLAVVGVSFFSFFSRFSAIWVDLTSPQVYSNQHCVFLSTGLAAHEGPGPGHRPVANRVAHPPAAGRGDGQRVAGAGTGRAGRAKRQPCSCALRAAPVRGLGARWAASSGGMAGDAPWKDTGAGAGGVSHSSTSPQALSFQPSAFSPETGVCRRLSAFIGGPHGLSRMSERPAAQPSRLKPSRRAKNLRFRNTLHQWREWLMAERGKAHCPPARAACSIARS